MVTVDEYEHPFIAHFYPNNELALKTEGGYWMQDAHTLNDYGIAAWKPAPERYNSKEYYDRRDRENERLKKK